MKRKVSSLSLSYAPPLVPLALSDGQPNTPITRMHAPLSPWQLPAGHAFSQCYLSWTCEETGDHWVRQRWRMVRLLIQKMWIHINTNVMSNDKWKFWSNFVLTLQKQCVSGKSSQTSKLSEYDYFSRKSFQTRQVSCKRLFTKNNTHTHTQKKTSPIERTLVGPTKKG